MGNLDLNNLLLEAIKEGNIDKVKKLIEQGADVNSSDKEGWALDIAYERDLLDIVNLLSENGAWGEEEESAAWEGYVP